MGCQDSTNSARGTSQRKCGEITGVPGGGKKHLAGVDPPDTLVEAMGVDESTQRKDQGVLGRLRVEGLQEEEAERRTESRRNQNLKPWCSEGAGHVPGDESC